MPDLVSTSYHQGCGVAKSLDLLRPQYSGIFPCINRGGSSRRQRRKPLRRVSRWMSLTSEAMLLWSGIYTVAISLTVLHHICTSHSSINHLENVRQGRHSRCHRRCGSLCQRSDWPRRLHHQLLCSCGFCCWMRFLVRRSSYTLYVSRI